jgi:hypothetical protein
MPYLSTPCGRATSETAVRPFRGSRFLPLWTLHAVYLCSLLAEVYKLHGGQTICREAFGIRPALLADKMVGTQ